MPLSFKPSTLNPSPYPLSLGFTLIEVLTVALIIALGSTLTFFGYQKAIDKQHLTQTTQVIISHTQDTQNSSILVKDGQRYGVKYFADHLDLLSIDNSNHQSTSQTIKFPKVVKISSISLSGNPILFTKLTGNPNHSGSLTLQSRSYQTTITITPTGQISSSEIKTK